MTVKPTGKTIDDLSETELRVKVIRPDGGKYDVTVIENLSESAMEVLIPGNILPVYYMPGKEKNIVIGFPFNGWEYLGGKSK